MDERDVTQTETAATTETAKTIVMATRLPKVTKRSIAELEEITNPAKMTDAEKVDYIKFLREEKNKLAFQADGYAQNAKSAYEQARNVTQAFENYKLKAQSKINWARQCVDHCRTAIILAGSLEE